MKLHARKTGLYLHIPFCERICHYCDFAKTARFSGDGVAAYLTRLRRCLELWLEEAERGDLLHPPFVSLYFGGGTPGLFASEYEAIMELVTPWLAPEAEVTMEANPDHVTSAHLQTWRGLGINRLSLGLQSLQDDQLQFLTRTHTARQSLDVVGRARRYFDNINADLIYGLPGQNSGQWQQDVLTLSRLTDHLSLYVLGCEGRTVFGHRHRRGRLQLPDDDAVADLYEGARAAAARGGMVHEEVSNWARPGKEAVHNQLYWHGDEWLGLGTGAHSFLRPDPARAGLRFAALAGLTPWSRQELPAPGSDFTPARLIAVTGAVTEKRNARDYLLEALGSGLRCRRGVWLKDVCRVTGLEFRPDAIVQQGLDDGLLQFKDQEFLTLTESEWFRESAWAVALNKSFHRPALLI